MFEDPLQSSELNSAHFMALWYLHVLLLKDTTDHVQSNYEHL